MAANRHKPARDKLKVLLESGYAIIEKRNLYQTPRIPRYWEKDFDARDRNFYRALHQKAHRGDFFQWENQLKALFEENNLSWGRFRRKTEDFDEKIDNYSEAAIFKRKIDELDKIVNSNSIFEEYLLPPNYPQVEFVNGELMQGMKTHSFYEEQAASLIGLLWDGRRIVNPKGDVLKEGKSLEREKLLSALKISNTRFMTIVRNIHTMAHRKGINIKVKFPKGQSGVYVEITQSLM